MIETVEPMKMVGMVGSIREGSTGVKIPGS